MWQSEDFLSIFVKIRQAFHLIISHIITSLQGTGDINKSSARPKEVTRMDGLNITQVTMGYSHTLLLCDDAGEEVKAKLASMPTFNP